MGPILAGLGILLATELYLRFTGYSPPYGTLYHTFKSTRLYLPSINGGIPGFRTNPAYQQEFQDTAFPADQGTAFRIIATGGSAVHGWRLPDRASQNFLARLTVLLRKRHPALDFEGINAGGCAWGSFREQILTRELLSLHPDLLIVMTGNNEVLEYPLYRDFTSGYFNKVRIGMAAERSRLYLLAFNLAADFRLMAPYQPPIDGNYPELSDADMEGLLARFGANIRSIISQCRQAGVPVIFGTTPANLKVDPDQPTDWLVGSSRHTPGLSALKLAEWNSAWNEGLKLRAKGDNSGALRAFHRAASIDPAYAREYDEIGKSLESLGRYSGAREAYWEFVDRNRRLVSRRINAVTTKVCREEGIPLVDVVGAFEKAAPHGLPGYEFFVDSMHPNIRGHEALAGAFFGAVDRVVAGAGRTTQLRRR
jgi:lysophospholipase L1-like esterase